MKKYNLWMLAAILTICGLTTALTACSDKDIEANSPVAGLPADLVNTWFDHYAKKGTLVTENGNKHYYVGAFQALTFNEDGTGTCSRFLCNRAGEPVSLFGGESDITNGRFTYTVGKDSIITITRDGDGDESNPKVWTVKYGIDGIRGTDGTDSYVLQTADAGWKNYIANMEDEIRGGSNEGEQPNSFLTNWENIETVRLSNIAEEQYTPWNGSAYMDIGHAVRFDIHKKEGWEMAFCELNNPHNEDCRIFGLYNRYTGTLRVFNYIKDPATAGYGNEAGFMLQAPSSPGTPRYPLYNSMEYAIPVCHDYNNPSTFDTGVTLTTGTSTYHPFETLVSAYTTATSVKAVTAGWHCTDIDLSGYMPPSVKWTDHTESNWTLMSIRPWSRAESDMFLTGAISGGLNGAFEMPATREETTGNASLSKCTSFFDCFSNVLSNSVINLGGAWTALASVNNPTKAAKGLMWSGAVISSVIQGVSTALNTSDDYYGEKTSTEQETRGSIDLTFDAKVNLNGVIKSWKSVNDRGVFITPALLAESNPNKTAPDGTEPEKKMYVGTGCFGLAKDPVVYVSQEDLLSTSTNIHLVKNGDNYTAPSWRTDSVRLVAFVDPRTVEVCLNTDLYTEIDSVFVMVTYGVNTSRTVGNSDSYRNMLKLKPRPTFSLLPGNNTSYDLTPKSPIHLFRMSKAAAIKNDQIANFVPDSVSLKFQATPKEEIQVPLYGQFATILDRQYILDPQVFVPYGTEDKNTTVYSPVIPDFVVNVTVSFKCKERPNGVVFVKHYIPQIELITHKQLKETYYPALKKYAEDGQNKRPIGKVHDQNINVYNPSAGITLAKTLDILNVCNNY